MVSLIAIGLLIILFTYGYIVSKNSLILWTTGFMSGLWIAKLIEVLGV